MEQVPLNNSPDLTMKEITKLLFNNKFMSDIQFHVGGKVMYAHSWEVMKRSIVFWQQFRTNVGENKLIPIDDVSYDAFYAFLKFIYTDQLEIKTYLICDMLKLAVRYKIVKLETQLLNTGYESNDIDLKLLEFGVLNKYELCTNHVLNHVLGDVNQDDIKRVTFLNMDETVLNGILVSDTGFNYLTECDLWDALVLWMNNSCAKNNIPLGQRRTHFEKLIRLIRFSAMSGDDLRRSLQKNSDILTNDDIGLIMSASLGATDKNCIWNSKPRSEYEDPWIIKSCAYQKKWHLMKFRVWDD